MERNNPNSEPTDTPAVWEILSDQLLNNCKVWDLRARRYRHPASGQEGDFYYLNSRDWVIVVARTTGGEFVLVRQFRWGIDSLSWEFPGGIIDAGEDPVEAGLRELQEETGYVTPKGKGRIIGYCQPNPAILNNVCHVVLAEDVELAAEGTNWDEHEEMQVRLLSEDEVSEWARGSKIGHALALSGWLYYQLNKTT